MASHGKSKPRLNVSTKASSAYCSKCLQMHEEPCGKKCIRVLEISPEADSLLGSTEESIGQLLQHIPAWQKSYQIHDQADVEQQEDQSSQKTELQIRRKDFEGENFVQPSHPPLVRSTPLCIEESASVTSQGSIGIVPSTKASHMEFEIKQEKSDTSVFECAYINGSFICNCKYSVPASNPETFFDHLWKELHPNGICEHEPKNNENHCQTVYQVMSGLLDLRARKEEQEQRKDGEKDNTEIKCESSTLSFDEPLECNDSKHKTLEVELSPEPHLTEAASTVTTNLSDPVLQSLYTLSPARCTECSFTSVFRTIHEQIHHVKRDEKQRLWCPFCSFSCSSLPHFKVHSLCHSENRPNCKIRLYHCGHCDLVYSQLDMIEDHYEVSHSNLQLKYETTYLVPDEQTCAVCARKLPTEISCLKHLEEIHGIPHVQNYLKDMYNIVNIKATDDERVTTEKGDEPALLRQDPIGLPNSDDTKLIIVVKEDTNTSYLKEDEYFQRCPTYPCELENLDRCLAAKCQICSFTTKFGSLTDVHELVHSTQQDTSKRFWCKHCPYSCDAILHFKLHCCCHAENQERPKLRIHRCSYCNLSFNQAQVIEDHHDDKHANRSLKYETTYLVLTKIPCSECDAILLDEMSLLEHLQNQHGHPSMRKFLKEMYRIVAIDYLQKNQEEEQEGANRGKYDLIYKCIIFEVSRDGRMVLELNTWEPRGSYEEEMSVQSDFQKEDMQYKVLDEEGEILEVRGRITEENQYEIGEDSKEKEGKQTQKGLPSCQVMNEIHSLTKFDDAQNPYNHNRTLNDDIGKARFEATETGPEANKSGNIANDGTFDIIEELMDSPSKKVDQNDEQTKPKRDKKRLSLKKTGQKIKERQEKNAAGVTRSASPLLQEHGPKERQIGRPKSNEDNSYLKCNHCPYTTAQKMHVRMKQHVMVHLNYRPYKCTHCDFSAIARYNVKKHLSLKHQGLPPTIKSDNVLEIESSIKNHYTTEYCDATGMSHQEKSNTPSNSNDRPAGNNNKHEKRGRKRKLGPLPTLESKSRKTTETTTAVGDSLPSRVEERHGSIGPQCGVTTGSGNDSETILRCLHCSQTTPATAIAAMVEHVKTHLNYNHIKCSYCLYTAKEFEDVKKHIHARHPGKQVSTTRYTDIEIEACLENHYITEKAKVDRSATQIPSTSNTEANAETSYENLHMTEKQKVDRGTKTRPYQYCTKETIGLACITDQSNEEQHKNRDTHLSGIPPPREPAKLFTSNGGMQDISKKEPLNTPKQKISPVESFLSRNISSSSNSSSSNSSSNSDKNI